jgi:hypothetical protein
MATSKEEWSRRLRTNPEIGSDDRPGILCDSCGGEKSRRVVTRHGKKPRGYSLCTTCLVGLGLIW